MTYPFFLHDTNRISEKVFKIQSYLLGNICRRKHESRLPGKAAQSLVLEIFKNTLDTHVPE